MFAGVTVRTVENNTYQTCFEGQCITYLGVNRNLAFIHFVCTFNGCQLKLLALTRMVWNCLCLILQRWSLYSVFCCSYRTILIIKETMSQGKIAGVIKFKDTNWRKKKEQKVITLKRTYNNNEHNERYDPAWFQWEICPLHIQAPHVNVTFFPRTTEGNYHKQAGFPSLLVFRNCMHFCCKR